jgi:hypothetical protein
LNYFKCHGLSACEIQQQTCKCVCVPTFGLSTRWLELRKFLGESIVRSFKFLWLKLPTGAIWLFQRKLKK